MRMCLKIFSVKETVTLFTDNHVYTHSLNHPPKCGWFCFHKTNLKHSPVITYFSPCLGPSYSVGAVNANVRITVPFTLLKCVCQLILGVPVCIAHASRRVSSWSIAPSASPWKYLTASVGMPASHWETRLTQTGAPVLPSGCPWRQVSGACGRAAGRAGL